MGDLYNNLIFIVDDDLDDIKSIHDSFLENQLRHEFMFFNNADQLLEHMSMVPSRKRPDLILLDLNMPGMDGRDVLRHLKKDDKHKTIPIIVLTTSSSIRDRESSYSLGANCFLVKPNTYKDLLDMTNCISRLWFPRPEKCS